jgi:hypothetical protein
MFTPAPASPVALGAPRRPAPHGRIAPLTRVLAAVVLFFLADAAQILLVLPHRTAELFAWPIAPHVTSFALGAAYAAGGYYFARVLTGGAWRRVAAGFPPVIVFVWLAAGATALHIDAFTPGGAAFAAWAAIYLVTPFGLPLILLAQRRGAPRERADAPLPRALRVAMAVAGALATAAALLAFAVPGAMIAAWPWALTPLSARVMVAVIALFASLWVSVALHAGRAAARIPLEAHAVGLGFLLLAGARGHADIAWSAPLAPLLAAGVAAMLLVDLAVLAGPARRR